MKEILRRYKIAKFLNKPIIDDLLAVDFIQNILNKMVMKYSDKYPNSVFYVIEDKI